MSPSSRAWNSESSGEGSVEIVFGPTERPSVAKWTTTARPFQRYTIGYKQIKNFESDSDSDDDSDYDADYIIKH